VIAADLVPDIIVLTETWCKEDVTNAFLDVPGYELQADLRRDREDTANGVGGGLLVYARQGLVVLPGDDLGNFNQYTNFKIMTGNEILHFILLYRPPSAGQSSIDNLTNLLSNVKDNTGTILIGDFNLPEIDWKALAAPNRFMNLVD